MLPQSLNPVCVALDTPDPAQARRLLESVRPHVGMAKIGMELFYAHGEVGYREVAAAGVPIFLDLKLHDIPNTVAGAVSSLMRLDPQPALVNVHAAGGTAMMTAAARAIGAAGTRIVAVTVLTSLSQADLAEVGFDAGRTIREHAARLAALAKASGLDGVVCSPDDLEDIRAACGPRFLTVVPGIRTPSSDPGDQKRIATPEAARAAGADILVIGRAITAAPDPIAAAWGIAASLRY
jgi:orotidine-5'-phosphate decarboxylase